MTAPIHKPRVRVVLVDDSEVVRMGLRALLGTDPALEIVGEAGNVATGVQTCLHLRPDVALLDIRLPDGTGFDACRQIVEEIKAKVPIFGKEIFSDDTHVWKMHDV